MHTTTYAFENLSGAAPDRRRFGTATFELDGLGGARCIAIVLDTDCAEAPRRILLPGNALFDEVLVTLINERREDIDLRLEAARDVAHALAFEGILLPRADRRVGRPPYFPTAQAA